MELEKEILSAVKSAMTKSIESVLTGYDSPLAKLVKSVVADNEVELRNIITESFTTVIRTDTFKESIVNAFAHKVSRSIISNNDGLFDKVSNDLKQDPIFKSKMTIAVANVVEECMKKQND